MFKKFFNQSTDSLKRMNNKAKKTYDDLPDEVKFVGKCFVRGFAIGVAAVVVVKTVPPAYAGYVIAAGAVASVADSSRQAAKFRREQRRKKFRLIQDVLDQYGLYPTRN